MAEANREDFEYDRLETLIKRDVSLSYKLLRYINSAANSSQKPLPEDALRVPSFSPPGLFSLIDLDALGWADSLALT